VRYESNCHILLWTASSLTAETDRRRPVTADSWVRLQTKVSDISCRWKCPWRSFYPITSFFNYQCHFTNIPHLSSRKGQEGEDWKPSNKATIFRTPENIDRQVHSRFVFPLRHESQRTSQTASITYTNGIVRLQKAGYFPQLSRPRWLWCPQNGTSGSFSCSKEHEAYHLSSTEMRKQSNHKNHCFTDSKYFTDDCVQQYSVPHKLVNDLP